MLRKKLKIGNVFLISVGLVMILTSLAAILWVNHQMRQQSLVEAESKARILLDRNLATHRYFTHKLRPAVFKLTQDYLKPEYFEPAWMSSTYAVREIDKFFKELNEGKYYYKECAINARSPENEADDFERELLFKIASDPEHLQWSGVREIQGRPYYVLLRRSETMKQACLRCHSDPKEAPKGLVEYYGSKRSFNRKLGQLTSIASIRIPLSFAHVQANKIARDHLTSLALLLLIVFGILFFLNKKLFLNPLKVIQENAVRISKFDEHLGDQIPLQFQGEWNDLAAAFNVMSLQLKKNRYSLEKRVEEATAKLNESNRELKSEIKERKLAEKALGESGKELNIRNRIAEIFLTISDNEMYGKVLQVVLEAMQSPYGTFAYINEDGERIVPSMTRDVWDECKMPDKDFIFPRDKWGDTLWARCLKEKKSFSSNGPFKVPEGHIPITRAMVVPIIHQGKAIGNLMVGNKPTVYSQKDRELLENIADHIAPILFSRLENERYEKKRKIDEETIRESGERFRKVFDNAALGMVLVSPKGRFLKVNPYFCQMIGYTEEELLTKAFNDVTHPDDHHIGLEVLREIIEGTIPFGLVEKRYLNKDGSVIWGRLSTSLVHGSAGNPKYLVSHIQDFTEHKLAEKEKAKLETQLQQAQKMESIGTLAGGISHDFNNILGVITGCTELSQHEISQENPAHNYLNEVLKAAYRAKDLVKQILTFSRQKDQKLEPTVIIPIVKEALKMLRSSLPATIDLHQSIQIDAGLVMADPIQIHQVIMNLGANAAHAMGEKGGLMKVSLNDVDIDTQEAEKKPGLDSGSFVKLTVSDTGHGMERETIEKIFDPYFTTKTTGEGTGLGLAVVHGIVKIHGGVLNVHSELGQGTTFSILFPRIGQSKSRLELEETIALPTGSERILFIDDEEILVLVGQDMLQYFGYKVVGKTSSLEALEVFRAHPDEFDLVITDQTMPGMTGTKLAEELIRIRQNIPIILCTGYSKFITPEKIKAKGIQEFLMKPLSKPDLALTVRKVLDQ